MKNLLILVSILVISVPTFGQSGKYETVESCALQVMEDRGLTGNRMFDLVLKECERLFKEKEVNTLFLFQINSKFEWKWEETDSSIGKYVGYIKNNKPEGDGKLYLKSKERYEGEWKNGLFHGFGSFFTNNGNLRYGTWQNGVPWEVSEIDKDGEVIRIWEEGVDIENEITPLNAPMFLSI